MKALINFQNRPHCKLSRINPRFCICLILFSVFLFGNSALYAQKNFSFSAGISSHWSMNESKFENVVQDNVVSEGGLGYYAAIGVFWLNNSDHGGLFRFTYENYKSTLQNWERIPIGSMNANVFRIDPIYFQYRIKKSKFIFNLNIAGFSVFTGKSILLPNSYCYDDGSWYLIRQIHVNNSIGWSLLCFGFDYEFTPYLSAGIETVMIEEDRINVTFLTANGDIKSNVSSVNSFFPVKFKLIIKI